MGWAHLCDPSLHDEKVWVVDIELDAVEEVLHAAAAAPTCVSGCKLSCTLHRHPCQALC